MSTGNLSAAEERELEDIRRDLNTIFDRNRIELDEWDDLDFDSRLVREYMEDLRGGSEPEPALKDKLVTSASVLARALFGRMSPEIRIEEGIVDYRVQAGEMPILLEIKPPFEAYPPNRETEAIRKRRLNWQSHEDQISRYREENEYLIFTNLDEWVFFSKRHQEPFATESFDEVYEQLSTIGNLREYLERLEDRSERGDLDEAFFTNLDTWLDTLHDLDYEDAVNDRQQTEAVISFINKFIFIQTLDDHFVIKFNWIEKRWKQIKEDWQHIGERRVLEKFLVEVNDWFYAYYDTELFEADGSRENFLDYIEDDSDNIEEFYDLLPQLLGLEQWQEDASVKGITNFNYRKIDEDIFGKAYETSLAERQEQEGIYYTGKEITRYMVEETVGEAFDEYVDRFETALDDQDFDTAKQVIAEMQEFHVVDPACGSGSFLIKAFNSIWDRYQSIIDRLDEEEHLDFDDGTLDFSSENHENAEQVQELEEMLGVENDRDLVAKIILQHIYGNDKDADALAVAKVNIWLESIKKVPEAFRYSRIPTGQGYTLPNLEINLQNGDALLGLPEDECLEFVTENHQDTVADLCDRRTDYLENHTSEGIAEDVLEIQDDLRDAVHDEFRDYLENENLDDSVFDETIPDHWPVAFWHAYFNEDGTVQDHAGFDVVLGNPPYINAINKNRYFDECERDFWDHRFGDGAANNAYDIYMLFLHLGLELAASEGKVTYIVPNKHLAAPYAESFRDYFNQNEYTLDSLTDVSQLNVFDDPSVYPVIPEYRVADPDDDTEIRGHSPPSEDVLGDTQYDHQHDHDNLDELDQNIWSFLLLIDDTVFWDIYEECQFLKSAGTVQASSTASEAEEFTAAISEDPPTSEKKKFIKTGAIDPLLTFWEFEEIRHQGDNYAQPVLDVDDDIITDLRKEQYESEKLIFAKVASIIEAFPDVDGSYATVDTNLFYDGDQNMLYYAGILNSHMADFLYEGMFGALRMRGGDFQYQAPQLKLIPIPDDDLSDALVDNLESTVSELLDRNHHRELYLDCWTELGERLSDTHRTLESILSDDKEHIQEGRRDLAWTETVPFYPDADNDELTNEYAEFTAHGEDDTTLVISAGSGRSFDPIYTVSFDSRELRDHVLAAMEQTLFRTRKKIETLTDVLEKTEIPLVRRESAENTPNIVDEIETAFSDRAEMQYSSSSLIVSFSDLSDQIGVLENKQNAIVFALYGIDSDEMDAVLETVDVTDSDAVAIRGIHDDLPS